MSSCVFIRAYFAFNNNISTTQCRVRGPDRFTPIINPARNSRRIRPGEGPRTGPDDASVKWSKAV